MFHLDQPYKNWETEKGEEADISIFFFKLPKQFQCIAKVEKQ
jgi:hypothetical protein